MKDIFHSVQKPYNLRNDLAQNVLWNRKHIFPCLQNMGDRPLRD